MRSSSLVTWGIVRASSVARERERLHPRVHRHHRAQPRELHAPHDGELQPDGAGGPQPAVLRRVGRRRHDARAGPRSSTCGRSAASTAWPRRSARARSLDPAGPEAPRSGGQRRPTTAATVTTACSSRHRGRRPSPSSSTPACKGETYAHEQIHVPMGTAGDFLEIVAEEAIPVYEEFGWKLCGAWETAMVNGSECFLHWAIPTWESWAETEQAERKGQPAAALADTHLRAQRAVAPLPRGGPRRCHPCASAASPPAPTTTRAGPTCSENHRLAIGADRARCGAWPNGWC